MKNMKKIISIMMLAFPWSALAVGGLQRAADTSKFAKSAGFDPEQQNLSVLIGQIIGNLLAFLGTAFVIYMIYGGYLYMTAQGNEDQVEKGKDVIKNAVIGMVIIALAYAITAAVVRVLV